MTIYEDTTFESAGAKGWTADAVDTCDAFWATVTDHDGPGAISFDRCVDWLLDLYQVTADTQLRQLISDVLEDLRAIGPVDDEFEDVVLGTLASVEAAFEIVHGTTVR